MDFYVGVTPNGDVDENIRHVMPVWTRLFMKEI